MSMKYHPDKNLNKSEEEKRKADKMFKEINEAHIILSDPESKKIHDLGGHDANDIKMGKHKTSKYETSNFDTSDVFDTFMQMNVNMQSKNLYNNSAGFKF